MRRSDTGILTTHVGALPPPVDVWGNPSITEAEVLEAGPRGGSPAARGGHRHRQRGRAHQGRQLGELRERPAERLRAAPEGAATRLLLQSKDWTDFSAFYQRALERGTLFEETRTAPEQAGARRDWECTGPLGYRGQAALQSEIDTLRAALGDVPPGDAFLTSTAPASLEPAASTATTRATRSTSSRSPKRSASSTK